MQNSKLILALAAALVVTLAAWLLPLPPLIAGEEALAEQHLPQTRQQVASAQGEFQQAESDYQNYIHTHDLAALLARSQEAIAQAKAAPADPQKRAEVRDVGGQIAEYTTELQAYAEAGERFFAAMRGYDDDLMSWTRALGAASESLRDETWPIVEYLKEYPQPVGLKADPPDVKASDVLFRLASLWSHLAALDPGSSSSSQASDVVSVLDSISADISGIWASGRSVEYIESLHVGYIDRLRAYDTKVQAEAQGTANGGPSAGRLALATGLNLLLGAVTLGGVLALFLPRRGART